MPGESDMKSTQNGVKTPPSPGTRFVDTVDTEDPEYIKDLQRPASIKEDLNEMERRKRVRQILESRAFREELEELITNEKSSGNNTDNLQTLEKLSELIMPKMQISHGIGPSVGATQAVHPIADMRGADAGRYSKTERLLRNKLACLYRMVDLFHWSQGIYNHITLRISQDTEHILINPFGLLYHEITASSLVKVDFHGSIIDEGSSRLGINHAGYVLHSAVHQARPDIRCVLHLHTPVVGAVAAMKCGLLPICQEAMIVGPVSYHDFEGILDEESERESVARDLGPSNKILLLRNHGFVACGDSVEEAFHLAYNLILACETQVMFIRNKGFIVGGESVEEVFHLTHNLIQACEAQIRASRAGLENLVIPSAEAQARAHKTASQGGGGVNRTADGKGGVKWKVGELEWEAWMRVLDNAGFRTGHLYRQPLLRGKNTATFHQSEVEEPPSSSAYGAVDDNDGGLSPHKLMELRRAQEKVKWLNSPNAYQKVEITETGTSDPKKITKWIPETQGSPVHATGTAIKIDATRQFSPVTLNPKEFKDRQKQIKDARRADRVSAGPQSHILDGATWEDAAKLKDALTSGTGDQMVMVGAASKGIIQRDHQHNAQIYRQLYQPNPFANETDEDIANYKKEVEKKMKGIHGKESEETDYDGYMNPGSPLRDGEISPPHSAESCSLMQLKPDISLPGLSHEATFEATADRTTTHVTDKQPHAPSPADVDSFRRAKSERFPPSRRDNLTSPGQNGEEQKALTDDETTASGGDSPSKKKKEKKKFKTPSFLKRKKDKKKEEEV